MIKIISLILLFSAVSFGKAEKKGFAEKFSPDDFVIELDDEDQGVEFFIDPDTCICWGLYKKSPIGTFECSKLAKYDEVKDDINRCDPHSMTWYPKEII